MLIKANGIQINYEMSKEKDTPVVALSHSLASSMQMWEPQIEVLESHFRVLRYDLRGHGKSEATEGPYTLEMLAEDVIALLDALNLEIRPFVIVIRAFGIYPEQVVQRGLSVALEHW